MAPDPRPPISSSAGEVRSGDGEDVRVTPTDGDDEAKER